MKIFDLFSRLVKGRRNRNAKPERKSPLRPRALPLRLELLEDRTLMSVAPPPILGTQSNLGAGISPMVVVDPVNSLNEVVIYSTPATLTNGVTGAQVAGKYSTDGGSTWKLFTPAAGLTNLVDPQSSVGNPYQFTQATNATVAFDRSENFYVTYTEHNGIGETGGLYSGVLVLQKFNLPNIIANSGTTQPVINDVLDRWYQIDPILNPVVAVDANVPSYNDPVSGATVTDTMVGKAVYVAWNTSYLTPITNGAGTFFNPDNIKVIASDGETLNANSQLEFTTEQYVNNGNIGTNAFDPIYYPAPFTGINGPVNTLEHAADPKILFTQGTPTPSGGGATVAGGQLVFIWNDFGQNSVVSDTTSPDKIGANPPLTAVAATATYTDFAPASNGGAATSTPVDIDNIFWTPAGGGRAIVTLDSAALGSKATISNVTPAGFNEPTQVPITTLSGTSFSYSLPTNPVTTSVAGATATVGASTVFITNAVWAPNSVTITANNTFNTGDHVTIAGVTPTGFNGDFTITSATPTKFTYDLNTSPYVATGNFSEAVPSAEAMATLTTNPGTNAITEAVDNGNDANGNDIPDTVTPTVFTQTLTAPADANFLSVNDLDVTVNLVHPNMNQVSITLTGPTAGGGTATVTLLNNRIDRFDNTNGNVGVAPNVSNPGLGEINRDTTNPSTFQSPGAYTSNTSDLVNGAVFDQQAPRAVGDASLTGTDYIAHFRPDNTSFASGVNSFGLDVFNGLTRLQLTGSVWTLTVTDNRNDIESNTNDNPRQYLDSWSLHFSGNTSLLNASNGLSTTGFHSDVSAATGNQFTNLVPTLGLGATVPGSADPQLDDPNRPGNGAPLGYSTKSPVATEGIGPGVVVAQDNTLGSFSPYTGRIYVAYVGPGATSGTPNHTDNTDVYLIASNDGGQTWTALQDPVTATGAAVRVNQDSPSDNFSQGNRPQFLPALTVDPVTGTVVVSFYDGRYDASDDGGFGALARVTTTLVTSIDGGQTFSPDAYLNNTKTAVDAITGLTVNLEPIPDNMGLAPTVAGTALGFGTQMGLAVVGGRVTDIWSGNINAAGANLLIDASPFNIQTGAAPTNTDITAGPRVVGSDEGPVIAPFTAINNAISTDTPKAAAGGGSTSSSITMNIPSPDNRIANVPGAVQVSLNITDAFDNSNLHIFLTDPDGHTVQLVNVGDASGSNFGKLYSDGTFGDTTFADTAATLLTSGTAPYLGTFMIAVGALDSLIGDNANGTWTLTVDNTAGAVSATLNHWSLSIKTAYNNTFVPTGTVSAPPGERELDAFEVTFDRPIEVSSFTTSQIHVSYLSPTGTTGTPTVSSITPLDPVKFGPRQVGYNGATSVLASRFLVHFTTPQVEVGTYSYSVGPTGAGSGDIQDLVESDIPNSVQSQNAPSTPNIGNFMDQNGNGKTDQPSATGATPTLGDVYFAPTPVATGNTGATPFSLPYDPNTLPLIIPGPYVLTSDIGAQGAAAVASPTSASTVANVNLAVNSSVNFIDVTFDRDMLVSTFTPAAVLRLIGPTGLIPLVDGNGNVLVTVTPISPTGSGATQTARSFKVSFPTQTISGTYSLVLDSTIQDSLHEKLDTNHNAGLDVLRLGVSTTQSGIVTQTNNTPTPIPHATVVNGNTVPTVTTSTVTFAQDFIITNATVSLFISDPNDPDLTAQLVAPDGTVVTLFQNPPGNNSNQANFGTNAQSTFFTDASNLPIDNDSAPYARPTGYDPQTPLAVLNGKSSAGTWKLVITNIGTSNQTRTLNNWSLNLTQTIPSTGLGELVADQATVGFRIFTQDPSSVQSSTTWTAVGPTADNQTNNIGRITAIAVDPSDPSGNTVFAAAAGGGIWKTTNFLNNDVQKNAQGAILYDASHNPVPVGPTWISLTDFGPEAGVNIGSIAVFARNSDPKQTFVIAGTGEGPLNSAGVGFIVSSDGGATWKLIDSANNNFAGNDAINGASLPISSALRDHQFVGNTTYKIVIDPNSLNASNLVIYAAMGGANGGVWKSINSGATWGHQDANIPTQFDFTALKAGTATDVVLAANSAFPGTPPLLQTVWAGFQGGNGVGGVWLSTNAGASFTLQNGGSHNNNIQISTSGQPVPVQNPQFNPNGTGGRVLLATPALLPGQPVANSLYQTWLYALALNADGSLNGLYMTKDNGVVWTKVNLPFAGNFPTNDETLPSYNVTGPTGASAAALAIDPVNPNIVYIGGSSTGAVGGLIQVDTTQLQDANAFYTFDNSNNDGGLAQASTAGGITTPSQVLDEVKRKSNPNSGAVLTPPFLNLERNPNDPFSTTAPVFVTGSSINQTPQFYNSGNDARFAPLDAAISSVQVAVSDAFNNIVFPSSVFYQSIVAVTDPLTQRTRLLLGTSRGIFDAVDQGSADGSGTLINHLGTAQLGTGARTGNMQTLVFESGASQPSILAAQIAGALFYGSTPSYGESIPYGAGSFQSVEGHGLPGSDPNILQDGNLSWKPTYVFPTDPARESIVAGDGVGTGAQGQGTLFQYKNPDTVDTVGGQTAIFQETIPGESTPEDRTGGQGNTLFIGGNPPSQDWPPFPGSVFALNSADPNGIVMSSHTGIIFLTTDQGQNWRPISNPNAPGYTLDNSYASALAFGAPAPQAAPGTLDNIILVGTMAGDSYVTTNGGGNANWKQITGLDGSPVMSIATDPTPGTHDAYAVTQKGVYYLADDTVNAPAWVNITGNLAQLTYNIFGNPLLPETELNPANPAANVLNTGIMKISSMVADWRFSLSDNPTDPSTGHKHPVLYIGGTAGVFRSLDGGVTWMVFPSMANDAAPVDGGYLPVTPVVDLVLSQGNVSAASGVADQSTGQDVLLALTAGRGAFAIRLTGNPAQGTLSSNTAMGPHVVSILPTTPSANQAGPVSSVTVTFSSAVDPTTFTLDQFVQNEATSTDNGTTTTTAYAPLAHNPILPGTLAGSIFSSSAAVNESTNTDSGNTTTTTYASLAHAPILPGTMTGTIFVGSTAVQTFVVSPTGVFTFTSIGTPTTKVTAGTLNLATGQLVFTWNNAPGANHAVVSYQYNQPIQTFTVDSAGNFHFTDVGAPTTKVTGGSLNLVTGQLTFTWNNAPGPNHAVVSYQYSDIVSFTDPTGADIRSNISSITNIPDLNGAGANKYDKYLISFSTPLTTSSGGVFVLTLGPSITDFSGNAMNETQTGPNGKPSDTYTGRFYLNSTATGPTASGLLFQNANGTFNALASNGQAMPTATSGTANAPFWDLFPTTVHWLYLTVGDFNGDGFSDYVGYLQETGQWWVTITTGHAGVQQSSVWSNFSNFAVSGAGTFVETLDVNGDGKTDLVVFDGANGKATVLESTGNAFTTSTWMTFTPTQAGVTYADVLVGDFNGDKKDDLTFRWVEGGQIYVALSNGTSAFYNATTGKLQSFSQWGQITGGAGIFGDTTVGDFNGDGKDDIAFLWLGGGVEYVALSNGTTFTNNAGVALTSPSLASQWDKFTPPGSGITYSNFMAADFNGDGKDDLFFRWDEGGQLYVATSTGTKFTNNAGTPTGNQFSLWGTAPADPNAASGNFNLVDFNVGDFNGDGKKDVLFRQKSTGNVFVGLNNGSAAAGAFLGLGTTSAPTPSTTVAAESAGVTFLGGNVGDFNRDGKTDYTLFWQQGGQWYVALSAGTTNANNTTNFASNALWVAWLQPTDTYAGVQSGDFNGDGLTDVVAFVPQTGEWFVSLSNGSGGYTTSVWTTWVVGTGITYSNFLVGDFNGDGKMDVAAFWNQGGAWYVNESTGTGFIVAQWTPFKQGTNGGWSPEGPGVTYGNAHVGNFNDDGFADIEAQWLEGGQVYVMTSVVNAVPSGQINADRMFSPLVLLTQLNTSHSYSSPVVGNFDTAHPGRTDFAIQDVTANEWFDVLTTVTGGPGGTVDANKTLTPAPYSGTTPTHPLVDVVVGNFKGVAGQTQIAGLDAVTGQVFVLTPNGTGTGFTSTVWMTITPPQAGVTYDSFVAGDMNGDGKDDLLFRWVQGGVVYIGTSDGTKFTGTFSGGYSQFGLLPPSEPLNANPDPNIDDPGVVFLKDL